MGMFAPELGEKHRLVLELTGHKKLTQKQYEAYKAAIAKIAKKHGAKIIIGEHVIVKKKRPKK